MSFSFLLGFLPARGRGPYPCGASGPSRRHPVEVPPRGCCEAAGDTIGANCPVRGACCPQLPSSALIQCQLPIDGQILRDSSARSVRSVYYLPLFISDRRCIADSAGSIRARTLCRGREPRLCAPLATRLARPARDGSSEPGKSCWSAWEATAAAWNRERPWRGATRWPWLGHARIVMSTPPPPACRPHP